MWYYIVWIGKPYFFGHAQPTLWPKGDHFIWKTILCSFQFLRSPEKVWSGLWWNRIMFLPSPSGTKTLIFLPTCKSHENCWFWYKTDHISSGDLIILLEETLLKAKIMAKSGHRVGWALCLILLSFWTHQPDYSGCTCVVMKISECSFQKPFASHSWFSDSLITSLSNGTHNLLFLHFIEFPFPWTEMLHCSELNHFWEIILVICQNVLHVLCK